MSNKKTVIFGNIIFFSYISFFIYLIFMFKIIVLNIFYKNDVYLAIAIIGFNISFIISSAIVHIALNTRNKLILLKNIIDNKEFTSISETKTDYYENDKIKSITSSDQQAKVLIAAIEAIKDL